MTRDALTATHALAGQAIVDDTSEVTGLFSGMLVVADTVVSAMSWQQDYEGLVTANKTWADLGTLSAGLYLPGMFKSITLTSGKVILIRA